MNREVVFISLKDKVPNQMLMPLKDAIDKAPEERVSSVTFVKTYESIVVILLSIFLGGLGVDRFYIGDKGKGGAKLGLTIGAFVLMVFGNILAFGIGGAFAFITVLALLILTGVSIWAFIDIFLCYKESKKRNFYMLYAHLTGSSFNPMSGMPFNGGSNSSGYYNPSSMNNINSDNNKYPHNDNPFDNENRNS